MSVPPPSVEPESVRVGDTWQWTKTLSDYPATTWTLTYTLVNATRKITITATASGTDHAVSVAKGTTDDYVAGTYTWISSVTDGVTRTTIATGSIELLPDLAASATASYDARSHARKVLDAIEAVIEGRATKDQEEYQIAGRMLRRTPIAELLKFRDRYRAEAAAQENSKRLALGLGGGQRVMVRL